MYSILYADDVLENRILFNRFLDKLDCELILLEDGLPAFERVKAGGIDLLILDVSMPGMSGDEVARAIRKKELEDGLEPLPILALSAYSDDEIRQKYPDAGFTGYLCKPISRQALIGKLGQLLPGL